MFSSAPTDQACALHGDVDVRCTKMWDSLCLYRALTVGGRACLSSLFFRVLHPVLILRVGHAASEPSWIPLLLPAQKLARLSATPPQVIRGTSSTHARTQSPTAHCSDGGGGSGGGGAETQGSQQGSPPHLRDLSPGPVAKHTVVAAARRVSTTVSPLEHKGPTRDGTLPPPRSLAAPHHGQ